MPGTFSLPSRVSDPDMHHGTWATHVPWCMSGSLNSGFPWSRLAGKTFPAFPVHAKLAAFVSGKRPIEKNLLNQTRIQYRPHALSHLSGQSDTGMATKLVTGICVQIILIKIVIFTEFFLDRIRAYIPPCFVCGITSTMDTCVAQQFTRQPNMRDRRPSHRTTPCTCFRHVFVW